MCALCSTADFLNHSHLPFDWVAPLHVAAKDDVALLMWFRAKPSHHACHGLPQSTLIH